MNPDVRAAIDLAMSEDDWKQQVIDYAELRGWSWWRDNDSRRNRAGFPDLMLLRGDTLIFLELKTEKGKVMPAQEAFLQSLRAVKHVYADVARPHHWPQVEKALR